MLIGSQVSYVYFKTMRSHTCIPVARGAHPDVTLIQDSYFYLIPEVSFW